MGLTRDVAEWVAGISIDEMPADVRSAARVACLDTVGAILAGAPEPVTRIVADALAEDGARPVASQLGARFKTSVEGAALLNGVSGHALDYDDVNRSVHGHPSVVVLPAALAVAEQRRASGRALLEAYIAGVEVMTKLGRVAGKGHYSAGWHATSTLGTLGSAAAAGRLLGLDAERLAHALAIATSEASGSRRNFGTMTKPFHAGHAARCGIVAARLASRGMTGDAEALEAPLGFFALFAPQGAVPRTVAATLGQPFDLVSPGVSVKQYPCCFATHRAADAVLDLVREHEIAAADVAEVRVTVPHGALAPLISRRPRTGLEGKFSMGYVVAAAVCDRALTLDTFTDAAVLRTHVQDLLGRVAVAEDEEIRTTFNAMEEGHAEVRIRLRSGAQFAAQVDEPRGSPGRPLGREALAAKFRDCARRALPDARIDRALALLDAIDTVPDVGQLIECLAPPEP
jgi:2-methylcitrate dehydratase PrpD